MASRRELEVGSRRAERAEEVGRNKEGSDWAPCVPCKQRQSFFFFVMTAQSQPSVILVPEDLTSSSNLHKHHACTLCTYIQKVKILIYVNK